MPEPINAELQMLITIATDMALVKKLRTQAIQSIGHIGTREALLALLDLAACENLNSDERDLALKQARGIVRQGR
jgi:HEAT repeat protein